VGVLGHQVRPYARARRFWFAINALYLNNFNLKPEKPDVFEARCYQIVFGSALRSFPSESRHKETIKMMFGKKLRILILAAMLALTLATSTAPLVSQALAEAVSPSASGGG
jgi:hypothetical protein